MRIFIHYFAVLREQRGADHETVETSAATPSELYRELSAKHGFSLPTSALKVAINDDFARWSQSLNDGDRVAFLPPVAGG